MYANKSTVYTLAEVIGTVFLVILAIAALHS
jgi:hypothetical protein